MIIAHRGASKEAPENTIPAFELAWRQKADGIEGDFHLTKDNQAVCIHDADTSRVSNTDMTVAESTLGELRKLDVGKYRGDEFSGAQIPTLEEVLETIPPGGRIYIEVKSHHRIIPYILAIVEESSISPDSITFISFDKEVIRRLKKSTGSYKGFLLQSVKRDEDGQFAPTAESTLRTLDEIGADGVSTSAGSIDGDYISEIKSEGYEYHVWTVDDPARAQVLFDWGVDSVTTNVPKLIRDACGQLGA